MLLCSGSALAADHLSAGMRVSSEAYPVMAMLEACKELNAMQLSMDAANRLLVPWLRSVLPSHRDLHQKIQENFSTWDPAALLFVDRQSSGAGEDRSEGRAIDLQKFRCVVQRYLYQRMPGQVSPGDKATISLCSPPTAEPLPHLSPLPSSQLGQGSYSVVYCAQNRETRERVAIKKLKYCSEETGFKKSVIREISMLKELQHSNVVQ
jgi:hypothetical protein